MSDDQQQSGETGQSSEIEQHQLEGAATFQPDPELSARLEKRVHSGDYRFCTDPNYRFWPDDKNAICEDVDGFAERCPTVRAACARPAWGEGEQPREATEDSSFWDGISLDGFATVIFWLAVGAIVFFLGRALLRKWREFQPEAESNLSTAPVAIFDGRSSSELLALARAALERGELHDALHYLYKGTVVALGEAELIKPHKSKTTREYVREIEPPLRSELDALTRQLDGLRFRSSEPARDAVQALAERVFDLVRRTSRAAPLILLFFVGGCEPPEIPESPVAPNGPQGHSLFENLLREEGVEVTRRLQNVTRIAPETDVIVVFDARLRDVEWQVLREFVEGGGHLVVTGAPIPFLKTFSILVSTTECKGQLVSPQLRVRKVGPTSTFSKSPAGFRGLECDGTPAALFLDYGNGSLTLVADDAIFENRFVSVADNATLVIELVGEVEGKLEMIGEWTGSGSENPLQTLARSGIGPWAAHLLLALALYAWSRGKRFGTPEEPRPERRRSFVEHVHALGGQYAKKRASGWALERYAEWLFETMRRRLPSSGEGAQGTARVLGGSDDAGAALGRALTLSRKASELGENERAHQGRFRTLEAAAERLRHGRPRKITR